MKILDSVLKKIGDTPLIRLKRVTRGLPVNLLIKLESLNPGGSVKDRIGLAMVEQAEKDGKLKPGGTIIEATAGNTGVGLALAAAVKGYRCIFVLPDKMSRDKIDLLKAYGAEVVIAPTAVPPDSPESYNGVAERLSREIHGAFRPNQFGNPHNPNIHYLTTGPEIWEDTGGTIDIFVAGIGTGGTISGVGKYLKERKPDVIVIGADPEGSILSGDTPKPYKVEGIGEDFIPATFDRQVVDDFVRVSDRDSFVMARRLAREEGLLVGGSSGTAVAAAIKYAHRLPPEKTIVALLPDTGRNYLTKIFSDAWMSENSFYQSERSEKTAGDVLGQKSIMKSLVFISPTDKVQVAFEKMQSYGISQLPVLEKGRQVGSVNDATLAELLHDERVSKDMEIGQMMGKPLPQVDVTNDILEVYRISMTGSPGVVVTENDKAIGFLGRIDLVHFWSRRGFTNGDGI